MSMKRLKSKLLGMEPNTATYEEMYNGRLVYKDPMRPNVPGDPDFNPTYYRDDIGSIFLFTCINQHSFSVWRFNKNTVPLTDVNICNCKHLFGKQ